MSEVIKFGLIGKEDLRLGTGTFKTVLADGREVTLSQIDIGLLNADFNKSSNFGIANVKGAPFNAVGDGITDDSVAIQNAINSINSTNGGTVFFPSGTYLINTKLSISNKNFISLVGVSDGGSILKSGLTGITADPVLEIINSCSFVTIKGLKFQGNSLTSSSGNGHAIYVDGKGASTALQEMIIFRCWISGFKGNGLDRASASIPSCGIYATESHSIHIIESVSSSNQYGFYLDANSTAQSTAVKVFKFLSLGNVFDSNSINGGYIKNIEDATFSGMNVFNSNGSGNSGEGNLSIGAGTRISISGSRFKNGNPWEITSTAQIIYNLMISDNSFQHYVNNAGIGLDSSIESFNVSNNWFEWVTGGITSANGIQLIQGGGGFSSYSGIIKGNRFEPFSGMVGNIYININVLTNVSSALDISNNILGNPNVNTNSSSIVTGIAISGAGGGNGVTVSNNTIGNIDGTTTNGISVGSAFAGTVLNNNQFIGTVTNQIVDSGVSTVRMKSGNFTIASVGTVVHSFGITT